MEIIITPSSTTASGTRYEARLNGRVLCVSRTPFFTAARVLQREGFPGHIIITMRHHGSSTVSMRMSIGQAARHTVRETAKESPMIVAYKPTSDSPVLTPRVA